MRIIDSPALRVAAHKTLHIAQKWREHSTKRWAGKVFMIHSLMIVLFIVTFSELKVIAADDKTINTFRAGAENTSASSRSIEILERQLIKEPTNVELLVAHSMAELALGNFKSAEQDLDRALSHSPNDTRLYRIKCFCDGKLGDDAKTIADTSEVIKRDPKDTDAYLIRMCSRSKLKQYGLAVADGLKAISIQPQNAELHHQLAIVYTLQNQMNSALNEANEYIKLKPNAPEPYSFRADLESIMGNTIESKRDRSLANSLDSRR